MNTRSGLSRNIRVNAAELAAQRNQSVQIANGEEFEYRKSDGTPSHIANFTKGLPHDDNGLLRDPLDYNMFVRAIDSGDPRDFSDLRLGPGVFDVNGDYENYENSPSGLRPIHDWRSLNNRDNRVQVRAWESQGAGNTFDLEGPDAQAVSMPPAPRLDSHELIAEMAEVYWMAILRDIPFSKFSSNTDVLTARNSLSKFAWFNSSLSTNLSPVDLSAISTNRRRIVVQNSTTPFPIEKLFRGVTRGDDVGPYISQFLLIGNEGINSNDSSRSIANGLISYGSIRIDQKVRFAKPGIDYLTDWSEWLDVQNGADLRGTEEYDDGYRFITTPRDLATYVHYDALYQAYLNACLILLGMGAPFDPGIPFQDQDFRDKQQGFAQFGGPHILSLVTEVATRALKAVRFQKFNIHRRLRPEAVGGLLYQWDKFSLAEVSVIEKLFDEFSGPANLVNAIRPKADGGLLLPMAFREGSPMHPSYGAGHATVAGACVTILKAFFDHGWQLPIKNRNNELVAYESDSSNGGRSLSETPICQPLTVEGELNKLASNISIGRNWAGVHYFSDYIESIRLGEEIAIGILEEQKLTYSENFSMTVPLFDGGSRTI
ncbi:MAG: vanadium-dependent haloperoxidase [Cyanobacteria bacterium P01_F01_bin.143]